MMTPAGEQQQRRAMACSDDNTRVSMRSCHGVSLLAAVLAVVVGLTVLSDELELAVETLLLEATTRGLPDLANGGGEHRRDRRQAMARCTSSDGGCLAGAFLSLKSRGPVAQQRPDVASADLGVHTVSLTHGVRFYR